MVLELKELPKHLKYDFLSEGGLHLAIINNTLSEVEDEKLLSVLRKK